MFISPQFSHPIAAVTDLFCSFPRRNVARSAYFCVRQFRGMLFCRPCSKILIRGSSRKLLKNVHFSAIFSSHRIAFTTHSLEVLAYDDVSVYQAP
eukprot:scaffold8634_cov82-Cyclotella_meneghiniana.AAC.2